MFNKIMIALHGSESRETAKKMVGVISREQAPVTVLHVMETGLSHYGFIDALASSITKDQFIDYINDLAAEQKQMARELLISAADGVDLNYIFKTVSGKPGPEILKEVESVDYDLVIIGRKKGAKVGNTSTRTMEFLVGKIPCSLFIFS